MQTIAQRILIPENTKAILWDMDGVLIDSLGLDLTVCNQLLAEYFGDHVKLSHEFIRSLFAYHPPEFWNLILQHVAEEYNIPDALNLHSTILPIYDKARCESVFEVNLGIIDILKDAKSKSLKLAVVSNNLTKDVEQILQHAGIYDHFDLVVGNDIEQLKPKPAPDTYLFAAKKLGLQAQDCVVVEDSLLGSEAGFNSGAHVIGVATGGSDYQSLANNQSTHQIYSAFSELSLNMQFGDVTKKHFTTPNDFVSHMVEHIAWRLCVEIDLNWNSNNWLELGKFVGTKIRQFDIQQPSASALGMIDDGSAEVSIDTTAEPELVLDSIDNVNLDWFLSTRCEQLDTGKPLVELMQGLTDGLQAKMEVKICSVEDLHHAWEGVFRAIGISLNRIFTPKHSAALAFDYPIEENVTDGELKVLAKSLHYSKVFRGTAESHVVVSIDFSKKLPNKFVFNVASNIDVSELHYLLETLANEAEFTMQVEFNATVLNSSHVVLEDTALVLGKALLEIITLRMRHWGVNGAGSSIHSQQDMKSQPIRTGISVEGRKFWIFVPFKDSKDNIRKNLLIGQNVYNNLRSEDLDDFLDGLSGGLACSIIVHIDTLIEANEAWQLIFANLGKSLKEAFALNPYRKGVPPGVKATLA
jgi:beta-phosphoglucomutase-like phosphatase (HAD superfamily)/imidazoleglycerol phosphate dehydratase HisB